LDERLSQAQESYAAQDFLRAFALCKEVLDAQPDCVEALVLFGQLCLIAGEYLTAVQCLRLAEHIDPEHSGARALLVGDVANDGYREILKLDPSIANHTSAFVFSQIVPHAARLESMLREIIALRPDLVDMSKAVREIGHQPTKNYWTDLVAGDGPLAMMEHWSALSQSGVMGDPTKATAEKGEKLLAAASAGLAEIINEMRDRRHARRVDHH